MNDTQDQGRRTRLPVGSPPGSSALAYMAMGSDGSDASEYSTSPPRNGPASAPPGNPSLLPERYHYPTRSSTAPSPNDYDHTKLMSSQPNHPRSEDLNHAGVFLGSDQSESDLTTGRSPTYLSTSRPVTPTSSNNHNQPSSSDHTDGSRRRPRSIASDASLGSDSSATGATSQAPASTTHTSTSMSSTLVYLNTLSPLKPNYLLCRSCSACGKTMQGAFVRALGAVYHLNCFKCMVRHSSTSYHI